MPIYDFVCDSCQKTKNDEFVHKREHAPLCCNNAMRRLPSFTARPGWPKGGLTLTNVAPQPVHFQTRNELRNYKRENDLDLGAMPYD